MWKNKKVRKKKYKVKPVQKLKRLLDKLCSQVVKLRDDYTCQWCNKKVFGSNCHWSHIYSRTSLFTRWDLLNSICLCFHCHQKFHGGEGLAWFKEKFPARYKHLNESLVSSFTGQSLPRYKHILRVANKMPFMQAKLKELQDKLKELK